MNSIIAHGLWVTVLAGLFHLALRVALDGLWLDWPQLVLYFAIKNAAAWGEVRWFAATRKGFADVP